MGWDAHPGYSKEDLVAELTTTETHYNVKKLTPIGICNVPLRYLGAAPPGTFPCVVWYRPLHKLVGDTSGAVVERSVANGDTLWVVEDMVTYDDDGVELERHRQIVCYHLAYFFTDRGWAKYATTEIMGPTAYDCPLQFLDAAPEYNADWRAAVRAFHSGACETAREAYELFFRLIRERHPGRYS